jgi:hypothetical protein
LFDCPFFLDHYIKNVIAQRRPYISPVKTAPILVSWGYTGGFIEEDLLDSDGIL